MIVPTYHPGERAIAWSPSSQSSRVYQRRLNRGLDAIGKVLGVSLEVWLAEAGGTPTDLAKANANFLSTAVREPSVALMVATSGGWASLGLLEHIDWHLLAGASLALAGSSDLTVLLNAVTRRVGLVTYLAPMVLPVFGDWGAATSLSARALVEMLQARPGELVRWPKVGPLDWSDERLAWEIDDTRARLGQSHDERLRVLRSGEGEGRVWGGSLRSLNLMAGTDYWPYPAEPSVVFLEDEGLSQDEFFALLTALKLRGAFANCQAVLLGIHSRPRVGGNIESLDQVIEAVVPPGVVIVAGCAFGHTVPQLTVPLGSWARLRTDPTLQIDFLF